MKKIGWPKQFLCTIKKWVFLAIFWKKKFLRVAILGKPLYEVKIFAEPHQWWNFVPKILFQKCFKKGICIRPKNIKILKSHYSLIFQSLTLKLYTHMGMGQDYLHTKNNTIWTEALADILFFVFLPFSLL